MKMVGERMNSSRPRDYNKECCDQVEHKYAYDFDIDVMHGYMIRAFEKHFVKGSVLELGSFRGEFTHRLRAYFEDITCVEASSQAISVAKERLGGTVRIIHGLLENVQLESQYDNIILTHVLEHTDDPSIILGRINNEWLSAKGRLFLVCPNAKAASRQIAVKMGLIKRCDAVSDAEAAHGHKRTYSMDTLMRDALAAGLRIGYSGGIFFKALANFQWDMLLKTDIISQAYLDGCYELGVEYPELCASLFLLCEKGEANGSVEP